MPTLLPAPVTAIAMPAIGPILIVEDDELIREILVMWLESDGWSTVAAGSADEALALAADRRPGLAICDMWLNGGPGGEWLSAQLQALDPTMGIIFASGDHDLEGKLTMREGLIGYLLKPFGRREVLAQVQQAAAVVASARDGVASEGELEAETIHRRQTLSRSVERIRAAGTVDPDTAAEALLSTPNTDHEAARQRLSELVAVFGLDMLSSGLAVAARFRNLGRAVLPERLLLSPRGLRAFERRLVRQYPLDSAEALANLGWHNAAAVLWSLREQWNGLGYPFRLQKEQIPLAARILAVFDTFEAVTAERPHRRALPRSEAVKLLKRGAGAEFDPAVVDAFVTLLAQDEPPSPAAAAGAWYDPGRWPDTLLLASRIPSAPAA